MREHLFRIKISRAAEKLLCMDPIIKELSPEQLAALHVMKHEVLAAMHRVYTSVPAEAADKLLESFIQRLPEELGLGSTPSPG